MLFIQVRRAVLVASGRIVFMTSYNLAELQSAETLPSVNEGTLTKINKESRMEDTTLIKATNISKTYGNKKIFEHINLTIHGGQSIVFVGSNGCGKSTLLRILANLTTKTSGDIIYSSKLKISYVPEKFPKLNITAREYLNHMSGVESGAGNVNVSPENLLALFYMEQMQDIPMKHLSKGTLQKVAVIQAMLTRPSVLFLDEPLSGQDVKSQKVFVDVINRMKSEGTAIVTSCHERYLIEEIGDIIFEIQNGTLREMKRNDLNLHKMNIENFITSEYTIVTFLKPPKNTPFSEPIMNLIEEESSDDIDIKFRIKSIYSNKLILNLLQNGWVLKEMYHENNQRDN